MNAPDCDTRQGQEEQLVLALKRVDMGAADHDDAVELAAALGLSRYITIHHDLNSTRKEMS